MECHIHQGEHFPKEAMQEHHIHPRAYGGGDEPTNLVWICSGDHDILHRAALRLYAGKAGEARDIVDRYLPNQPARQERLWRLVQAVARARMEHARSTDIPEAGLDQADIVLERTYRPMWQEHAFLETESVVAIPDADRKGVTVHVSCQCPFYVRTQVAKALGFPLHKVTVVQSTVGGGFGGKEDVPSEPAARAAVLAILTGRPLNAWLKYPRWGLKPGAL